MFRGRFAPSPTGEMHLGNARTALLCWLQARNNNGKFVLRLEDLDTSRIRQGAADQILFDLEWLGLDWDEGWDIGGAFTPYIQSQRLDLYAQYAARLETYRCSCSRKDIQDAVSAPHDAGNTEPRNAGNTEPRNAGNTEPRNAGNTEPRNAGNTEPRNAGNVEPRYAGTCRTRATHARATALRYQVPDKEIAFTDGICGTVLENVQNTVGDFVIRRNDGAWAYQLACVVDDLEMQISDVLRGEDLLGSTARQITLYQAFGTNPPRFYHVPLLTDFQGKRLAKRDHALSLKTLEESGINPKTLTRDLAQSLGWQVNNPCQPKDLLEVFNTWMLAQASFV
jgi:glutamyl-tRNA synthetase